MKISFNDKSLQTTFEYPPESSLQEEEAEAEKGRDEEEESEEGEGEVEASGSDPAAAAAEKPFTLFLPRATFVNSVGPESPRLPDGSSGECPPVGMVSPGGGPGHTTMQPHIHRCACRPAGLSGYTPKHSVAFSKWQERALEHVRSTEEPPSKEVMVSRVGQAGGRPGKRGAAGGGRGAPTPGRAPSTASVSLSQLTPAGQNDLADFRSEPALYF